MLLDSGSLTFTIPYWVPETGITQGYENDLDYVAYTGNTTFTGITYYNAIGLSKLSEYKKYGGNGHTIALDILLVMINLNIKNTYKIYKMEHIDKMDSIDLYEMSQEDLDAFINYQDKPTLINIFKNHINLYKYKYTIVLNVYIAIAIMYFAVPYFTDQCNFSYS